MLAGQKLRLWSRRLGGGGGDPYHMVYGDGVIFITCEMQNNARVILTKCLKTSYNYIIGCINIFKKKLLMGGV